MKKELSQQKLKSLRKLQLKKFRTQEECFFVEGGKLVREALEKAKHLVKEVIVDEDTSNSFKEIDIPLFIANQQQLKSLSLLKTPSNCIAVLEQKPVSEITSDLVIYLDDIQNPGNLGTIIRLAAWFGIKDIVASPDTAEVYNPKVVQATMGGIFDVNINYLSPETFFENNNRFVYGATMQGENCYTITYEKEAVLVIGNEGKGISKKVEKYIDKMISIPKLGAGESLNAAMATGILISEMKRNDLS